MGNLVENNSRSRRLSHALAIIRQWALLIPEIIVLLALLPLYILLGQPPLLALLIPVVVMLFTIRITSFYLARTALAHNRKNDAQALSTIALALNPWSADAQTLSGVIALMHGNALLAEHHLADAVRLFPNHAGFYTLHSSTLFELKRFRAAAEAARQAIRCNPQAAQAYLCLAEAEEACGSTSDYIETCLRNGLAIAQTADIQAAFHYALACHLCSERRFAEASLALRCVEALLNQCSSVHQVELRYLLGELLITQGQNERAQEYFQSATNPDPHRRKLYAERYAPQL